MAGTHTSKENAEESTSQADFGSGQHSPSYSAELQEPKESTGRKWRTGAFIRLPFISIVCLILIVAAGAASVVVLLVSDGKDRASWISGSIPVNLPRGTEKRISWQISVNALLSIFVFVAGNALAVMFAEAVAVSWWTSAFREQSLRSLHFRWEAGQSALNAVSKPRLFNWVCVGTLAVTIFNGLEALLQNASSSTTALSEGQTNVTATLASRLPDGFSGVYFAAGHDEAELTYLTPAFVDIIQDYTTKADMTLAVEGCTNVSTSSCTTTLRSVGFSYSCNTTRSSMSNAIEGGPSGTVFSVSVDYDIWSINLRTSWKDKSSYYDNEIINETCTLQPALVEYPVNISQTVVKLQPSTSEIDWTNNAAQVDGQSQLVDKVINLLTLTSWETELLPYASEPEEILSLAQPGYRSVLGGIYLAFNDLFTSSISFSADPTYGPDLDVSGSFAAPFALFGNDLNVDTYGDLTFSSPMPQLIANIREIMFRSSIAIVERNLGDWITDSTTGKASMSTQVPKQTITSLGGFQIWHTVYKKNRTILAIAIVLMAAMVLAIMPLYWQYWRLGRKVSLSPLEIAVALHTASIIDVNKATNNSQGALAISDATMTESKPEALSLPKYGSNFNEDELVRLLGDQRVKYGEVSPGVLGMGEPEVTIAPRRGEIYL